MKNLFFAILLLLTSCSNTKPTTDDYRGKPNGLVTFQVWNNSLLPHKYTLIGYNPGERGNWTNGLFLLPGVHRSYSCPVGTKIYRATSQQADLVMNGRSIYQDTPFLTVKAEDSGKSFRLNK